MKNTILILLSLSFWTCSEQTQAPEDVGNSTEAEAHSFGEGIIHLTPVQVAQAGIEYGSFTQKMMGQGLMVNAELVVHPEHTASVTAFSEGILSDIRTSLNAHVRKGQVLAIIRKPELLDIQQQFLENKDGLVFLQAEFDRYQLLKNADATALKNFQKADTELRSARTTGQVLAAKLRQYQIDPDKLTGANLSTQLSLLSPVSGIVTAIHSNVGAAVQGGTPVCEVTDMSQLHADLWVFEKDLLKVKNGQRVSLVFPADRSKSFWATIYSIDKVLDPDKRAVCVHAKLEGGVREASNFVNGAFLEAMITTKEAGSVNILPEDAVVREGDIDYIFIFEKENGGEHEFRKVPVQRGANEGGFVIVNVVKELPSNVKIVVKGAYYVSAQGTSIADEH